MSTTNSYNITNQSATEETILGSYPAHNVEKINDKEHCLLISVPGFTKECIDISTRLSDSNNVEIVVKGTPNNAMRTTRNEIEFCGFDIKPFTKIYQIPPFTQISSVEIEAGILAITICQFEPLGLGKVKFNCDVENESVVKVTAPPAENKPAKASTKKSDKTQK